MTQAERITILEQRVDALCQIMAAAYQYAGLPVPEGLSTRPKLEVVR